MNKSFITAIGTANPEYGHEQASIAEFMALMLDMNIMEKRKLKVLYRASGIRKRYSVLPDYGSAPHAFTFFDKHGPEGKVPTVAARMQCYQRNALPLASKAVAKILEHRAMLPQAITHIITVSCTGMYAPGLDIELVHHFDMPHSVQRTAVNFMGCYGAFNGLKLADSICRASPEAKVIVVCIEMCTLHFQHSKSADDLLSGALFGDGAAAVLVEGHPAEGQASLALQHFACTLIPEGAEDMAWHIADHGYQMRLSSYVPQLIDLKISDLLKQMLNGEDLATIDLLAVHPGGKQILERIEQALSIPRQKNRFAWQVLKDYGNMSSATVLFVLRELMQALSETATPKKILSMAFGPGLTVESALMQYVPASKILTEQAALQIHSPVAQT